MVVENIKRWSTLIGLGVILLIVALSNVWVASQLKDESDPALSAVSASVPVRQKAKETPDRGPQLPVIDPAEDPLAPRLTRSASREKSSSEVSATKIIHEPSLPSDILVQ